MLLYSHVFFLQRNGFGGRPPQSFGAGYFVNGLLCTLFGIAIIVEPDLVAYFIASFLLFIGISMLLTWWRIKNSKF